MGVFENWNIKFTDYLKLTAEELNDRKNLKKQVAEADWLAFYEIQTQLISNAQSAIKFLGSPLKDDHGLEREAQAR